MARLIDEEFARQLLSDLDRIMGTLKEIQGMEKVEKKKPCHPENNPMSNVYGKIRCEKCGNYYEKKEQRKLWEIMYDVRSEDKRGSVHDFYKALAPAAIDAVIECYEEWEDDDNEHRSFPEYLKEKLGNE